MRQAGVLAAAALYALDHHRERLAEDHPNAKRLAAAVPFSWHAPETNILLADVQNAPALVEAARKEGVLIGAVSATRIRAVTHLDFPLAQVDETAGTAAARRGPPLIDFSRWRAWRPSRRRARRSSSPTSTR